MESQYLALLEDILDYGQECDDRTGVGTLELFHPQDIEIFLPQEDFPLLTTKKMAWRNTLAELLWFISGSTNVSDLPEASQKWWTPWAKNGGELGPVYGALWRRWSYGTIKVDQLANVISSLRNDPSSRRHIMSTWHPGEIQNQALPPCHGLTIQFHVGGCDGLEDDKRALSCYVHQRSADCFIGLPHNLASYSMLLMMVAQVCGYEPYRLSYSLGSAHIYKNHIDQVREQLSRKPRLAPQMLINPDVHSIDGFQPEDFVLENYNPYPAIKGEVAV